ncbi:MAG: hypothetical protein AAFZ87_19905 [Planctomycetota bacterium]
MLYQLSYIHLPEATAAEPVARNPDGQRQGRATGPPENRHLEV